VSAELAQVRLRSGTAQRTCWTEARVKPGDRVTLKNSEDAARWWDVILVGGERKTAGQINRGWHNNI
jgi:hypothetical protein